MGRDLVICGKGASPAVRKPDWVSGDVGQAVRTSGDIAVLGSVVIGMPAATVEELDQLADRLAENAESANTIRSYSSDWNSWLSFCYRFHFQPLPADPLHVRRYLAQLAEVGGRKGKTVKARTVERHLAAIAAAHRAKGLVLDTNDPALRQAMRGLRLTRGTRQQGAKALRIKDIATMCRVLGGLDVRSVRNKAVILLGFAGAFRRSELVSLNVSDLIFEEDGFLRVTLRRSKTDQVGKGRDIVIAPGAQSQTCAVTAVRMWLRAAEIEDAGSDALFRSVNRWGTVEIGRVSDRTIDRVVKEACRTAGIKVKGYSAHSLRAGHVTEALAGRADRAAIKRQTGHASDSMLDRYAREADLRANNSSASLGL
jgi:site-specific recombinase XerD